MKSDSKRCNVLKQLCLKTRREKRRKKKYFQVLSMVLWVVPIYPSACLCVHGRRALIACACTRGERALISTLFLTLRTVKNVSVLQNLTCLRKPNPPASCHSSQIKINSTKGYSIGLKKQYIRNSLVYFNLKYSSVPQGEGICYHVLPMLHN